ncbi:hypothetical protein GIY23_05770 [Allosaccharopolyspora coralli]|uniref:Uncharacterized protein n=1 Tax=Allosaccharopolyspora coralli TaxID=2665642 RepID=A0A5Q3Q6P9_9PSEU|nr:hypothetical protein [Allosaccharopolyspora coralli]QGK69106.1 hypothetical protein GIY23_05770 [Allosaccharopolyspora coralli]
MDTSTDGPVSARARSAHKQDPAGVWAPLSGLADAAAQAASTGSVAISRGFDRTSRVRGKALRDLLVERGVSAVEITPALGSERLLAGCEVAAVVNLVGDGSWQPHRLAAKLRAPLFVPGERTATLAGESERDVIGVTAASSGERDVALTRLAVLAETTDGKLEVTRNGETVTIEGGRVEVTLHEGSLDVHLNGVGVEETFAATEIGISTAGTPHRFIRDELPIADFEGALTVATEPVGLRVRAA